MTTFYFCRPVVGMEEIEKVCLVRGFSVHGEEQLFFVDYDIRPWG